MSVLERNAMLSNAENSLQPFKGKASQIFGGESFLMNKALSTPRRNTLLKCFAPSALGMCSAYSYVAVDGIFVGRGMGVDALEAVNLAVQFALFICLA
ncbi:MAG: hypothetical protein LBU32_31150 [Clostridiales bacterium]|jgi:Na+-driven multidrug efflux pump|nr:hypothetical protein [Clostridiales bacterium]